MYLEEKTLEFLNVKDFAYGEKMIAEGIFNDHGYLVNTQPVKEKLLRLAAHWTDRYITDMLIDLENFDKEIPEKNIVAIDFYFRESGVDTIWIQENGKCRSCIGVPSHYRGVAKVTYAKKEDKMIIYWKTAD